MEEQRQLYKTSSIVLAATLVHEKMKLVGLEPIPKRSQDLFYFVFDDDRIKREEIVLNFSNNSSLVCPTTFMEIVRQLKQRTKEYSANRREV